MNHEERIHTETILARDVGDARRTRDAAARNVEEIKAALADLQAQLPAAEANLEAAEGLIQEREAALHRFRSEQSEENRLSAARQAKAAAVRELQDRRAAAQRAAAVAREAEIEAEQMLAAVIGEKEGE